MGNGTSIETRSGLGAVMRWGTLGTGCLRSLLWKLRERKEVGPGQSLVKKRCNYSKGGLLVLLQPWCDLGRNSVFCWLCHCPRLCLLSTLWSDYRWGGFSLSQSRETLFYFIFLSF